MDEEKLQMQVDNLHLPDNLEKGIHAEVSKLKKNLDAIDAGMAILLRCVAGYYEKIMVCCPRKEEGALTDKEWEDWLSVISEEYKRYVRKFNDSPLNGCCRAMLIQCIKAAEENMKERENVRILKDN